MCICVAKLTIIHIQLPRSKSQVRFLQQGLIAGLNFYAICIPVPLQVLNKALEQSVIERASFGAYSCTYLRPHL